MSGRRQGSAVMASNVKQAGFGFFFEGEADTHQFELRPVLTVS